LCAGGWKRQTLALGRLVIVHASIELCEVRDWTALDQLDLFGLLRTARWEVKLENHAVGNSVVVGRVIAWIVGMSPLQFRV
jgi:hypothetical protein